MKDNPEMLSSELMAIYRKFQGDCEELGLAVLAYIGLRDADVGLDCEELGLAVLASIGLRDADAGLAGLIAKAAGLEGVAEEDNPEMLSSELMAIYRKFQGDCEELGLAVLASIGLRDADAGLIAKAAGLEGVAEGIKKYWAEKKYWADRARIVESQTQGKEDVRAKILMIDGIYLAHMVREKLSLFKYICKGNNYVHDALVQYYSENNLIKFFQ